MSGPEKRRFETVFGRLPQAAAAVPGRVNLIGEHIDYTGGTVLPTVLPCHLELQLHRTRTNQVRMFSTRFGNMVERTLDERPAGEWFDYLLAAQRKAIAEGISEGGADVFVDSAIPHGAGVSSSAALIVAVLLANAEAAKADISREQVACWAQEVERKDIGVPCGIMDQMAVAMGRPGFALAFDTARGTYKHVPLPEQIAFPVYHSGITRGLVDGQYKERFLDVEQGKDFFRTEHLSLLPQDRLRDLGSFSKQTQRRVRHVITENARVLAAIDALTTGDVLTFGRLMNESHVSMRDDFEIVPPLMDEMTAAARHHGAFGARLTGGGFGGCFVSCVSRDRLPRWERTMTDRFPAIERIG